jgi:hypothetical protein
MFYPESKPKINRDKVIQITCNDHFPLASLPLTLGATPTNILNFKEA